jgi:hypothetical protein
LATGAHSAAPGLRNTASKRSRSAAFITLRSPPAEVIDSHMRCIAA